MIGRTLAHYEVVARMGAGGMGDVYRGIDTRLDCAVTLEVVPDRLAGDPDRLARLEREAKLLASLNHPCVAQVCGVIGGRDDPHTSPSDQASRSPAIVLEPVEGEELSQRELGRLVSAR